METGDPGDVEIRGPRGFGSKDQGGLQKDRMGTQEMREQGPWGHQEWGQREPRDPGKTRVGVKGTQGSETHRTPGVGTKRTQGPGDTRSGDKRDPGDTRSGDKGNTETRDDGTVGKGTQRDARGQECC